MILPNHRVTFTQAVFHPFIPNILYATGWEHNGDDRLLGIKGCFNRPSGIWEISTPDVSPQQDPESGVENIQELHCEFVKLTSSDLSCRSPRVSSSVNADAKLVWLACPTGSAHAATSSLQCLDLQGGQSLVDRRAVRTVLLSVWEPAESTGPRTYDGSFPGLYPSPSLTTNPFLDISGKQFVVLDSVWGSRSTVLLVPLDSENKVIELTPPSNERLPLPYNIPTGSSWTLLGASGHDHILCSESSPILPHHIWLLNISNGPDHHARFTSIGPDPSSRLPDTSKLYLHLQNTSLIRSVQSNSFSRLITSELKFFLFQNVILQKPFSSTHSSRSVTRMIFFLALRLLTEDLMRQPQRHSIPNSWRWHWKDVSAYDLLFPLLTETPRHRFSTQLHWISRLWGKACPSLIRTMRHTRRTGLHRLSQTSRYTRVGEGSPWEVICGRRKSWRISRRTS